MKKIFKLGIGIVLTGFVVFVIALFFVCDVSIELTTLYTEAIAAFFGFGAAIVGSEITEYIAENHERKQLLRELQKEMLLLKEELPKIKSTDIKITPIKTPCLKNAIKSQKIALLSGSNYIEIQRKMLQVDEIIDDYNAWNKLVASGVVLSGRNYSDAVSTELDKLKNSITVKIDDILLMFNEII